MTTEPEAVVGEKRVRTCRVCGSWAESDLCVSCAVDRAESTDEPVTWEQIVEHCSRLHTTRTRRVGPWTDELREGSTVMEVEVAGEPARIIPTRMHEPGFYWWVKDEELPRRADLDLRDLKALADAGEVRAFGGTSDS